MPKPPASYTRLLAECRNCLRTARAIQTAETLEDAKVLARGLELSLQPWLREERAPVRKRKRAVAKKAR